MLPYWILIAPVVFVLDQLSKWVVVAWLTSLDMPYWMVTDFFNVVLVYNKGVSFGMFAQEQGWAIFLMGSLAWVVGGVLIWLARGSSSWERWGYCLIAGGAWGNGLDRFVHGGVVDFLDFHVQGWHFWAFNVADIGISMGVMLLLISSLGLLPSRDGEKQHDE